MQFTAVACGVFIMQFSAVDPFFFLVGSWERQGVVSLVRDRTRLDASI